MPRPVDNFQAAHASSFFTRTPIAIAMPSDLDSLSIVVPLHNEQENIDELQARLNDTMDKMSFRAVEILLIDDGSSDRTPDLIRAIVDRDARYQVVTLSRNFGHQSAISVGLQRSRGQVVAIVDGDLQDPPDQIPRLVDAIRAGADVAYGVRTRRKEGWLKRMAYTTFYRLLRRVAEIDIPADSGDFCCMRRNVVQAILELPEQNRFVRGLRAWVGFNQVAVPYERAARFAGTPAYTWTKLIRLALDGLFSFTRIPVRVTQLLGFIISLSAIIVAGSYLALFVLRPDLFPEGFATITISIWLIAGVQLFFLGLIGEYLVRTLDEVRRRPTAVVAHVHRRADHSIFGSASDDIDPKTNLGDRLDGELRVSTDVETQVVSLVEQMQRLLQSGRSFEDHLLPDSELFSPSDDRTADAASDSNAD